MTKISRNARTALIFGTAMLLSGVAMADPLPPSRATIANSSAGLSYSGGTNEVGTGENISYQYDRGMLHYKNGEYDKASKAFRRVLREQPLNPLSNYFMGLTRDKQGHHKSAIKYLKRAQKTIPNVPHVHAALGRSYAMNGDVKHAKQILGRLQTLENDCASQCSAREDIRTAKLVVQKAIVSPM